MPNLILAKVGQLQRRDNFVFFRRDRAEARRIEGVIRHRPIGQHLDRVAVCVLLHAAEQLGAAKIASAAVVREVVFIFELGGLNNNEVPPPIFGKRRRLAELGSGQARRVGQDHVATVAEDFMGDLAQIGRIHATRIGHRQAGVRRQNFLQLRFLRFGYGGVEDRVAVSCVARHAHTSIGSDCFSTPVMKSPHERSSVTCRSSFSSIASERTAART